MQTIQQTLRFLFHTNFPKKGNVEVSACIIESDRGEFKAKFYHKKACLEQLIVLINGFGIEGSNDQRIANLAYALAQSGYRVLCPSFDSLNTLSIHPQTILDMQDAFLGIVEDQSKCPEGKFSLFVPSYTAGMALIAINRQDIQEKIKSIVCVGSYANIESSINFVLGQNDIDDYGRNILFKNFYPDVFGTDNQLDKIVQAALEDNGYKRSEKEKALPKVLAEASPADRLIWDIYQRDISWRKDFMRRALENNPRYKEWFKYLNVVDNLEHIQCPVSLIHGANDLVIPSSESAFIYRKILERNKQVQFLATPLLDHGDIQVSSSIINDGIKLFKSFYFFFKHA